MIESSLSRLLEVTHKSHGCHTIASFPHFSYMLRDRIKEKFIIFFFLQIPTSPSFTYQCVNGHIVCNRCRGKIVRCPTCRCQLGKGRCLIADKILRHLQNNSTIKIGGVVGGSSCEAGKNMSSRIDERTGRSVTLGNEMENRTSIVDNKSTEERNLHPKSSCLPFRIRLW